VFSLLRLLLSFGLFVDATRAKLRAVKQSAGFVVGFAIAAVVMAGVAVAALAVAGFIALRPSMADYQAALIVAGVLILIAGICALAAAVKIRRIVDEPAPGRPQPALPTADGALGGAGGLGVEDALVRLFVAGVRSPAVMSALALGITVGRVTKRRRRD
jgi:hypothetical protein